MSAVEHTLYAIGEGGGEDALEEAKELVFEASYVVGFHATALGHSPENTGHLLGLHTVLLVVFHCGNGFVRVQIYIASLLTFSACGSESRTHVAGHQTSHLNAEFAHLVLEAEREGVDGCFAGGIVSLIRNGEQGSYATGEEDASAFAASHGGENGFGEVDSTEEIDVHQFARFCFTGKFHRSADSHTRIADAYIYLSGFCENEAYSLTATLLGGDVASDVADTGALDSCTTEIENAVTATGE